MLQAFVPNVLYVFQTYLASMFIRMLHVLHTYVASLFIKMFVYVTMVSRVFQVF